MNRYGYDRRFPAVVFGSILRKLPDHITESTQKNVQESSGFLSAEYLIDGHDSEGDEVQIGITVVLDDNDDPMIALSVLTSKGYSETGGSTNLSKELVKPADQEISVKEDDPEGAVRTVLDIIRRTNIV